MKNKRLALLPVLIFVFILVGIYFPLDEFLIQIQKLSVNNKYITRLAIGLGFIFCVIALLPVTPIVMLSGFLLGFVHGVLLICIAGLFASATSFWLSRTLARRLIERKIKNNSLFTAIDKAVQRKGLSIIFLSRIAMVLPYGPLNYSLGLSSVSFRDYMIGTNIGMIPAFSLAGYLGTTFGTVTAVIAGNINFSENEISFGLAFMALVLVITYLIVKSAVRILKEELADEYTKSH